MKNQYSKNDRIQYYTQIEHWLESQLEFVKIRINQIKREPDQNWNSDLQKDLNKKKKKR